VSIRSKWKAGLVPSVPLRASPSASVSINQGESILLKRLEPLLCDDREMGGYTRAVYGQRLGKHVPVARQQILNNATV
jgi:hypothetical protein